MQTTPVFDGHNDTLLSLLNLKGKEPRSFFEWGQTGHLDLPRARAGGLIGALFAIFVPPPPDSPRHDPFAQAEFSSAGYRVPPVDAIDPAYAEMITDRAMDLLDGLIAESHGQVCLVRSAADLDVNQARDVLSVLLHIEGAEAIKADLSNLADYYQRGLRSIGLVWSRPNVFGYGINYAFPGSPDTGPGLTAAGMELVQACNQMGILVDMAHLNEKGFWDVARISSAPLVVSHIGVHAICATSRNLTDAQIDAVGRSGGLIGVMFEPSEIRTDGKPEPETPLAMLVDHVEYIANRIGIDCVGLGSDFDGAMMPAALTDAAGLPKLVQALEERGFHGQDLDKITHQNWLRVIRQTLK